MLTHGTSNLVFFRVLQIHCLAPISVVDSHLLNSNDFGMGNKVSQFDAQKRLPEKSRGERGGQRVSWCTKRE